jgi:hypothetical protein
MDCGDLTSLKVITTEEALPEYLTLSYVWGIGNEAPIADWGLLEELPRTVQDAIHVVKALGYRYLWVDRYCIQQDDESQKHNMISNMGTIYGNSVLTIIAAAGNDPEHGLPGVGSTPRTDQHCITISSKTWFLVQNDIKQQVETSTWNQRGWTFQEAILSTRVLVFTQSRAYFQCGTGHQFEDVRSHHKTPLNSNTHPFLKSVFPQRGIGAKPWDIQDRIREYCQRRLTYESDSYKAFQGICHAFEMGRNVKNLYGVPIFQSKSYESESMSTTGALLHGLSWLINVQPKRRPGIPSWTWAGWGFLGQEHHNSIDPIPGATDLLENPENYRGRWRTLDVPHSDAAYVQLMDGKELSWEAHRMELWQKLRLGWTAHLLRLYGFVFDVQYINGGFCAGNPTISLDVACESVDWWGSFGGGANLKGFVLTCGQGSVKTRVLLLASHRSLVYERIGLILFEGEGSVKESVGLPLSKFLPPDLPPSIELKREWVRIG